MLKAHEAEVDTHLKYIRQNLKTTTSDPISVSLAYVTREDLLAIYGDETVLTIRNHKEIYKPGLMEEDDKVVLDRALIVVSEDALDVKLVSQTISTKIDSQESTDSGIFFGSGTESKKRSNSPEINDNNVKKQRLSAESISDDELSLELEASAHVVLRKTEDSATTKLNNPAMIQLNPPAHVDYHISSLYDSEGVIDLFDIPCHIVPKGSRALSESPKPLITDYDEEDVCNDDEEVDNETNDYIVDETNQKTTEKVRAVSPIDIFV